MMPGLRHPVRQRWSWRLAAGVCAWSVGAQAEPFRPNILLITADDLGLEVGSYGDPLSLTPNLDQLAAEGVLFRTAWVTAPSCSPSRSSIFTGLHPHQNGHWGLAHHGYQMDRDHPNLSTILKDAGYRTGIIAKFHVAPESAFSWDEIYADRQSYNRDRDVREMASVARQFIEDTDGVPFFLSVNYIDPHVPLFDQRLGLPESPLTADDVEPLPFLGVDAPEVRERTAGYYNCVSRLDTGIRDLLDVLADTGHERDTLIIFLGDHGPPFSRAKTTCYDTGLRVPFIVRYPRRMQPGQVREELVSAVDILPTILDAVGLEPPEPVPGRSLMPLVEGRSIPWREHVFGAQNAHQNWYWFPVRTVRSASHQLIEHLVPGRANPIRGADGCPAWRVAESAEWEGTIVQAAYARTADPPRYLLFDLRSDPYSWVNLADEPAHQEIKTELIRALDVWREDTRDPLLDPVILEQMTEEHDARARAR